MHGNIDDAALRDKASLGDGEALYALGKLFYAGEDAAFRSAALKSHARRAAEGDADSQLALGCLYMDKTLPTHDLAKARLWLEKGVRKLPQANFYLGTLELVEKNYPAAVIRLLKAASFDNKAARAMLEDRDRAWLIGAVLKGAEAGDAQAQLASGLLYQRGVALAASATKAAEWLEKAAAAGDAEAQVSLAGLYFHGKDELPKNELRALELALKSAEQGNTSAQSLLKNVYFIGTPAIPRDFVESYMWQMIFAENTPGNDFVLDGLARARALLTPEQLAEAQRRRGLRK